MLIKSVVNALSNLAFCDSLFYYISPTNKFKIDAVVAEIGKYNFYGLFLVNKLVVKFFYGCFYNITNFIHFVAISHAEVNC